MALADPRAPVLVGVGEASGQKLKESQGLEWPSTVDLAAAAIQQALADSGAGEKLAASIDCLLSIRLFHDRARRIWARSSAPGGAATTSTGASRRPAR